MNTVLFSELNILYIDHLAYTTQQLNITLQNFLALPGSRLLRGPAHNHAQKVYYAFVALPSGLTVEILEPHSGSPISTHLQQTGGGPYHFCYAVADMNRATFSIEKHQGKCIQTPMEDVAFDGRRVAFFFVSYLGLFELVEAFPMKMERAHAQTSMSKPLVFPQSASVHEKLVEVFSIIFPHLTREIIPHADMVTDSQWTSLSQLRLLMAIEQSFQIRVPAVKMVGMTSFKNIYNYLRESIA